MGRNVNKVLEEYGARLVQALKDGAPVQSGNLSNSFTLEVGEDNIEVYGALYASMVDQGINGKSRDNGSPFSFNDKKPPVSALENLADKIGVSPFALQNSIFEKGYVGSFFMTNSVEGLIETFGDAILEAVWQDLIDEQNNNIE